MGSAMRSRRANKLQHLILFRSFRQLDGSGETKTGWWRRKKWERMIVWSLSVCVVRLNFCLCVPTRIRRVLTQYVAAQSQNKMIGDTVFGQMPCDGPHAFAWMCVSVRCALSLCVCAYCLAYVCNWAGGDQRSSSASVWNKKNLYEQFADTRISRFCVHTTSTQSVFNCWTETCGDCVRYVRTYGQFVPVTHIPGPTNDAKYYRWLWDLLDFTLDFLWFY